MNSKNKKSILIVFFVIVTLQSCLAQDHISYEAIREMKSSDIEWDEKTGKGKFFRAIVTCEEIYYTLYIEQIRLDEEGTIKGIEKQLQVKEEVLEEVGFNLEGGKIEIIQWITNNRLMIKLNDLKNYILVIRNNMYKIINMDEKNNF